MPYQIEPHALSDRIRGKLLFLIASPAFLVAMRRRSRRTELWIGDSHAMTSNRLVTNSMFMLAPDGQIILRAGARLMYSLAREGFPPRVMRVVRLAQRFGRPGAFVPVFSAGEIDIRAHLANRPDESFGFVAEYVDRCMDVARLLQAEKVGFIVPPPPVDAPVEEVWFPIVGTIEERVEAHRGVREALAAAVADTPGAVLIDCTDVLAGPAGDMPLSLTLDGSHTGLEAVARIREQVATHRLLAD